MPERRRRAILASHDGYDNNVFMLILAEDFGAFLNRGTGGEDVVDQDNPGSFRGLQSFSLSGQGNGTLQVLQALASRESRLCWRGADSLERANHGKLEKSSEVSGDFMGLVVVALLFPRAVKRYWDESPAFVDGMAQSRISKGFGGKTREFSGKVEVFLIFQAVDQLACGIRAIENGSREAELVAQRLAIGAHK